MCPDREAREKTLLIDLVEHIGLERLPRRPAALFLMGGLRAGRHILLAEIWLAI